MGCILIVLSSIPGLLSSILKLDAGDDRWHGFGSPSNWELTQ